MTASQELRASDRLWHIRLFGGLALVRPGEEITRFRSQKAAALLALLALHPDSAHPRDRLVDLLWPDLDVDAGRNNLRVSLASLRRQLEPAGIPAGSALEADRASLRLNPAAIQTDVALFLSSLQSADAAAGRPEEAERLSRAVSLYGGELLPGIYEPFVDAERDRLRQMFTAAQVRLARLLRQHGDPENAAVEAPRAAPDEPIDAGPPVPSSRLPDNGVRGPVGGGTASASPPASVSPPAAPSQSSLPPFFTRFCGREGELADLRRLVSHGEESGLAAMVTITGTGGAGKTRLAVEFARRFADEFGRSVAFVALADLRAPAHAAGSIRDALRLPSAPEEDPLDAAVEYLRAEVGLLLLDNVEQLLQSPADEESVCEMIRRIRSGAPRLTILVTSRKPFGMAGEQEYPLEPLPVPTLPATPERLMDFASVQLFASRAQVVRPDFRVTTGNGGAVAGICRALEGLPLAIELAAAWSKVLSPAGILRPPSSRLDLLVSRRPDRHPRHRTLRDALAWSYSMLEPARQRLFASLSVFRGGWTLASAESVCPAGAGGLLEGLAELVDCSLVVADGAPSPGGDEMRYRLLEPLREYAAEQMPAEEREAVGGRHLACFVGLAEECGRGMALSQREALDRAEADLDNFRAALAFAAEQGRVEEGLRLASGLREFWELRGHVAEGIQWTESFLSRSGGIEPGVVAKALLTAGCLLHVLCDYDGALDRYNRALPLFSKLGDRWSAAETRRRRHMLHVAQGRLGEAENDLRECARAFEELKDISSLASAYGHLANLRRSEQRFGEAEELYEKSLALFRQSGDGVGLAVVLCDYAFLLEWRHDYEHAIRLLEESLQLCRAVGNVPGAAHTLWLLANVVGADGDFGRATSLYQDSLAIHRKLGRRAGIVYCLGNVGELQMRGGDPRAAMDTFRERLALCRQIGDQRETARTLGLLGHAARRLGDHAAARSWLAERLAIYRMLDYPRGVVVALCDIALVEAERRSAGSGVSEMLRAAAELQTLADDHSTCAYAVLAAGEIAFRAAKYRESALLLSAGLSLVERRSLPLPDPPFGAVPRRLAELSTLLGPCSIDEAEARGRGLEPASLPAIIERTFS